MKVYLIENFEDLPKGTCVHVISKTAHNYIGICSFRATTFNVIVPQNICSSNNKNSWDDNMDEMIKNYLNNQKNPVLLFRKDITTEDEFLIASEYFDIFQFRSEIPKNSLVIGRYSTLPFYKELEIDLNNNGSILVNNFEQYSWIANFDWYEVLQKYTFKTWFRAQDIPDDGTKFVVKGRTNSRKHEWNRLMFAENKKHAIEIACALNEDSLIAPQGVIFREYVPLVTFEIGNNGLRFTNEYRIFFYKDKMLAHAYYWTMAQNIDRQLTPEGIKFAKKLGKIVSKYSNFFVLDIAEKESGGWVLVEINDGQMSGTSEIDLNVLYKNLSSNLIQI